MKIAVIIGRIGSDAGYVWIDAQGHIHRVPGWNPEAMSEAVRGLAVIREAAQMKDAGVSQALLRTAMQSVQKELEGHVEQGSVLVVG